MTCAIPSSDPVHLPRRLPRACPAPRLTQNSPTRFRRVQVRRTRMNRQASIATSEVLDTLPSYQADLLAQKFIEIYKDPVAMVTYLSSPEFAQDILKLAGKAKAIFEAEQVLARDRQQPPPQHARARAPNIQRLPMTASTRQSTQAPPTARCERGFTHMACAPPPPRPPSPRWDPL